LVGEGEQIAIHIPMQAFISEYLALFCLVLLIPEVAAVFQGNCFLMLFGAFLKLPFLSLYFVF
jgi:hypothetical protein